MSREPGLSVSILDSLHCSYVFTYVSHSGDCELLEDRGVVLSQSRWVVWKGAGRLLDKRQCHGMAGMWPVE